MSSPKHTASEQPRIESDAVCRICHEGNSIKSPLYHPCLCKGSIRYIHEKCLNKWLTHNKSLKCEVCGHSFIYKPIFAAGQPIPSSISYQSFIDIMCWIYDELIAKNSDLILRLPIISFLWLIICPLILFCVNHTFYRYLILYDLIHFNVIYAPLQSLCSIITSFKGFKLNYLLKPLSIPLMNALSYFCPIQCIVWLQTQCTKYQITAYFFFVHVILKGVLWIVLILIIFGITVCMKNTAKIVRPPPQTNHDYIHPQEHEEEEEEEETKEEQDVKEEEEEKEHLHRHQRKRKARIYCDENDYKSPSLLIEDDDDMNYEDDDDEDASSTHSTLSELEMQLEALQQRIKQKKEEQKEEEEEIIINNNNQEEMDDLDVLLDSIGLNDDIPHLLVKHVGWMSWLLKNHCSHFLLPHFVGQVSLHLVYLMLWIIDPLDMTRYIIDFVDFNQYNDGAFIYTHWIRNMTVIVIGYVSCFVYQWMLCTIMPCFVNDLRQFVRSSLFAVYLWLFDKHDILKGCFFLLLKLLLFPFILTLVMEWCFVSIRQESQWSNYVLLYEMLMLQHRESTPREGIASSIMYVLLMLLWTLIAICTYLSTVDVLEKSMRPTAFTYLFRSVIETKNWLHPFSYQEQSVVQFRKWCQTTVHFTIVLFAFLGIPCYCMSHCPAVIPLNVPSVGKIKSFEVRSLLLQDYVLLFSVLPMLLFWEPILRALVIQTLDICAYLLNLKFYLLRNYAVRDVNIWHNEQPFLQQDAAVVEDNVEEEEEVMQFIDETVYSMIDNAIEYSITSLALTLEEKNDVVHMITECIEWIQMEDMKEDLDNVQCILDYVCIDGRGFYRIQWKGLSWTQSTWHHIPHLSAAQSYEAAQSEEYSDGQIVLYLLWNVLQQSDAAAYGVTWLSHGTAFEVTNQEQFRQEFIVGNRHVLGGSCYELFRLRMCLWGFEVHDTRFYHPCFTRQSDELLPLIGQNMMMKDEEEVKDEEEEEHQYYAALLDEANNQIIEIEEHQEEVKEDRGGGMDMMGLFDGIDLGGADNIIPAPIVMNVQLDNFGRLIKINVELDSYNEEEEHPSPAHVAAAPPRMMTKMNANVMDDVFEEEEEEEEHPPPPAHVAAADIGELMRSLNSYQKSELLRDILSICHPLYITEEKYCFIYDHNTKSDLTHPMIRVLKKPSQLISIRDIVTLCDMIQLYFKLLLTVAIVVLILNVFHLILFLQCLVYGRKLWKIASLLPKYIIFELGFTNFTRFDHYGIMSFAFNEHTIHDLHCIALSLWWFPAMYALMNLVYRSLQNLCTKCSKTMDDCVDCIVDPPTWNSVCRHVTYVWRVHVAHSIRYLIICAIHHVVLPLLFGFCFFFALWSPVFIGCNQSFCCSLLEAWIEGFFVWNVFLPMAPLSIVGDDAFKQRLKVYFDTPLSAMQLCDNCYYIYWPLLRLVIIHLFVPIAFIQSPVFKYLMCDSRFKDSLMVKMKNYNDNEEELLFQFNCKWYLSYMMRKLLQCRLFIGYQRAIRTACDKLWHQFINDKYVIGKKLVNYYYKNRI